jgi:2-keto-4-pentenoate hydratase/2-oxohepta-3-ene-1,7-dioic acid hydratase in catechol pathway
VLADDLSRATAIEAEQAILGYSVLVAFPPGFAALLGPVLVTRDEIGALSPLRTQLRVDGAPLATGDAATSLPFSLPEHIAWISHHVPLTAGDVIRAVPVARATGAALRLSCAARVDFTIERIGRLSGRLTLGPEPSAWRRASPCA